MSITNCTNCGTTHHWSWEDAFDKFGFDDGDGMVMTETVAEVLRKAGYSVTATPWGWHNVVITSITRDGVELMTNIDRPGYDDPRGYLPQVIIEVLDAKLGADMEVQP